MDAAAELAIMAKATQVFEDPGTFLCFPAPGDALDFSPATFDFSKALCDPPTAAALQDFSIAVSRCPADPIMPAGQTTMLWDEYGAVLQDMVLASSALSPASQTAYQTACALLFTTDANGLRSDSPAVLTYKQYRDAAIAAQQAYKAAQSSAANQGSTAAWLANEEPALRAAVDAATSDWATSGNKATIEAAQATVISAEASMPDTVRAGWLQQYQPILDHVTNAASGLDYAPSLLNPTDIASQSWNQMPPISAAEIASLVAAAPKPLRDLYGDVGSSTIASITFEYRSAALVRPWFDPKLFTYRFWTLPDGTRLSDGRTPPAGAWPAYVTAVVLVRKVAVTEIGAPPSAVPIREPIRFNGARPIPIAQTAPPPPAMRGEIVPPMRSVMPIRPIVPMRPMMPMPPNIGTAHPVLAANPLLYRGPIIPPHPISPPVRIAPPLAPAPITVDSSPPPPPAAPPPDDRISVLAFLCRPLGLCPNPEPAMSWAPGTAPTQPATTVA